MITAVINGEAMGRQLANSKSDKISQEQRAAQGLCHHPSAQIKAAGNKNAKWFTCLSCATRWERLPLPDQSGPPKDEDLMLFGPHAHVTYGQVYNGMRNYVSWLLESPLYDLPTGTSMQQTRFMQYCTTRRSQRPENVPIGEDEDMDNSFEDVAPPTTTAYGTSQASSVWTQELVRNY